MTDRSQDDVKRLTQLADGGDVDAMYRLGVLLHERGEINGDRQAVYWLYRASGLGHASATTHLALLLQAEEVMVSGESAIDGMEAFDVEPALERFIRAVASSGDADAMYTIGMIYYRRGNITGPDGSLVWWRQAGELGQLSAMHNLAVALNERGEIDGPNGAEAWFRRAADHGKADSMVGLALILDERGLVDGHDGSVRWYELAAQHGSTEGMYGLGVHRHRQGRIDGPDSAEHWFRAAAERGNRNGMTALAQVLQASGRTVGPDGAAHWQSLASASEATASGGDDPTSAGPSAASPVTAASPQEDNWVISENLTLTADKGLSFKTWLGRTLLILGASGKFKF